ncbi:DUF6980 family protein [Shewanella xiamenensis]|uniref:DUF6980 family protein n=1 Tax=Shewanella xiamenensis TaxID=332186 RepID=UPI001FB4DB34|nr:hypothetical protein [Shewanella xiamenensis]
MPPTVTSMTVLNPVKALLYLIVGFLQLGHFKSLTMGGSLNFLLLCRYLMNHCCEQMKSFINNKCDHHVEECAVHLINYSDKFDEYGLIIHDGGTSSITINFCPWCGSRLPTSRREQWFDELGKLGYSEPFEQDIPEKYKSSDWYRV